ncbi:MAG: hypothetical protein ACUVYA_05975 [Planctomycetota bacterium]
MDSGDYFLLASAVFALACAFALATRPRPKKPAEAPKEVTRWRRFRVRPALLAGPLREAKPVVDEEPKGLKVIAAPRTQPFPIRLVDKEERPFQTIARKWRPFRWSFRVDVGDGEALELVVPKKGPRDVALLNPPRGPSFEIRGSVSERDYQIVKDGKLVGIVDRTSGEGSGKDYVVEVLKTEDPAPVLRLALALEAATA